MRVALVGPLVKDKITVDRATIIQLGGIPYYEGIALQKLGAEVMVFTTYALQDSAWVRKQCGGLKIINYFAPKTIEFERFYSSANPDVCISVEARYAKNRIEFSPELIKQLNSFDYVIFGPMFYDNISPNIFTSVKKEKSILGNFGMFTYPKGDSLVWQNPENLLHVLPHLSYLFLDDRELSFVAQKDSMADAIKFLQTKTDAAIVVTLGSKGSLIFEGDTKYAVPAFPPVRIGDPTGAGDTYVAGFIRALGLYKESLSRGTFAAMTATMKLENRGAFEGSIREVLARLAQAGVLLD